MNRKIEVWKCRLCDWKGKEEPPFTEKACGCCWDFQCPRCGGAVENNFIEKKELNHWLKKEL